MSGFSFSKASKLKKGFIFHFSLALLTFLELISKIPIGFKLTLSQIEWQCVRNFSWPGLSNSDEINPAPIIAIR